MNKCEREMRLLAREFGLDLTKGGKHRRLTRDGALIIAAPRTSSDWRGLKNLRATLRPRVDTQSPAEFGRDV